MAFSLHERALYTLLAVDRMDQRRLVLALEGIEADPTANTDWIEIAPDGQRERVRVVGDYRIKFWVGADGKMFVHDILKP